MAGGTSMDIRQITYFVAVAQNGSFSKAAEMLSLSQPTLSLAVKKLEEELGVRLFYSFNKRQELTDEGRALLESARQLLDDYQRTVEHVQTSRNSRSGTFTLGLAPVRCLLLWGPDPQVLSGVPGYPHHHDRGRRQQDRRADRRRSGGHCCHPEKRAAGHL